MTMRVDAAVFDLDGTLLDTLDDLWAAVNAAMAHVGAPTRSRDEVRRALGRGARYLIDTCLPSDTDEKTRAVALDFYIPYYEAHAQRKTAPYPGIEPMLRQLRGRGVRTAVVSNKPDAATRLLAARHFPGLLDAVSGVAAGMAVKPAPDSILAAMDALGAAPGRTVYIGDSEVDIAAARNAGIPCVSVTWGFRDEAELRAAGASLLAHDARELSDILLE